MPKQIAVAVSVLWVLCASSVNGAQNNLRQFYVSTIEADGAHALTTCAKGFHMASLWEILNPTDLAYNATLGENQDDEGLGPPSGLIGWIRNGWPANAGNPGGNCTAWTSNGSSDFGTFASLTSPDRWGSPSTVISPWVSSAGANCSSPLPVWCVQDVK
jgi:hypothetical protein